jgi:hypothetical protein
LEEVTLDRLADEGAQRGTLLACLRMAPLPAASAGAAKRKNCQNV